MRNAISTMRKMDVSVKNKKYPGKYTTHIDKNDQKNSFVPIEDDYIWDAYTLQELLIQTGFIAFKAKMKHPFRHYEVFDLVDHIHTHRNPVYECLILR